MGNRLSSNRGSHHRAPPFDLDKQIANLPPSQNKNRKAVRVIILTGRAKEILQRRMLDGDSDVVFRNTRGRSWTKDSINCRFQRLKKKPGSGRICAYGIRHSFATEGLKR